MDMDTAGQGEQTTDKTAEAPVDAPLSLDDEIVEIKKLLEADPDDFQAQCRLGEVYFAKCMLDEAYEQVSKAIDIAESLRAQMAESLAMYYAKRGTILATQGKLYDPMEQFKHALKVNPRDVLAYYNLISTYEKTKRFAEADQTRERLKSRFASRRPPESKGK